MRVRLALVSAAALLLAGCPSSPTSPAPSSPAATATAIVVPSAAPATPATTAEPVAEPEPAEDTECTLDRDAIKGAIAKDAPSVAKVLASAYDAKLREHYEQVLLRDGVTLAYSIGGCHHYAYGFTWENVPAAGASDVRAYARLAKKLLDEAPLQAKDTILSRTLEIAIADAPEPVGGERPSWTLPCGDANCELSVTRKGDLLTIAVSYDFGL